MLEASVSRPIDAAIAPWAHLDVPQRMARVIDRLRTRLDGTVTEGDFHNEPETADLDLDELRANIGKAQILVVTQQGEPPYDREARIVLARSLILGLMPAIPTMHTTLRDAGFSNAELGQLWPEIVARVADDFHADRAPITPTGGGLPDWGRKMLSENAN